MDTHDPAGEYLRIFERYRRMSDEEILVLLPQSSELTPVAQQALASEVRQRGLQAEVPEAKIEDKRLPGPAPLKPPASLFERKSARFRGSGGEDSSAPDSADEQDLNEEGLTEEDPYEEDRKLVDLCTVWSERDALQVEQLLDLAAIPFFMGAEKATRVDAVTSNYTKGVAVKIMRIGIPWASAAMQNYGPEDDPTPKQPEVAEELPMRCPKCRSEEVVFEGLAAEAADAEDESVSKFQWSCDACGYEWEDDGLAKEG